MLLAVDVSTLYLYEARLFQRPLGRWGLCTYEAMAGEGGSLQRTLTLNLDTMGNVELDVPVASAIGPMPMSLTLWLVTLGQRTALAKRLRASGLPWRILAPGLRRFDAVGDL
jgi:hypothetical protein